jgi:hypothetical protein
VRPAYNTGVRSGARLLAGIAAASAVASLGGCFAPTPPSGAPCAPGGTPCPSGQRCVLSGGAHVCTSGTGDPLDDAALADTPTDGSVDALPDARLPLEVTYTAVVAECINPAAPDPLACRAVNGNTELAVDLLDSATQNPWEAFIRFDADDQLAGRTVTAVTLRMVVTTSASASGPDSGSVFRVSAFTRASLDTTTPTKLDATALAGSRGAVTQNDVVDWPLSPTLVTSSAPVYLGVYPNDTNGVSYWNLDGTTPPRLIVDAQ